MKVQQGKLSRVQERAIAALLQESTVEAAAKSAGISERTLRRWQILEPFQTAYKAARRSLVDSALSKLQQATGEAVATLRKNLECGQSATEVRAALAILDTAIKGTELMDVEERLQDLEKRIGERREDAEHWRANSA